MAEIWPFEPQADFTETLTWKTDVLRSETSNQRISIRPEPLVELALSYQLPKTANVTALRIFTQTEDLIVPMWSELDTLATLSSGSTSLTITPIANKSYIEGSYIYFVSSLSNFEAVLITDVTGDTVTFEAIVGNYTNAAVMPAHIIRPVKPFDFSIPASDEYTIATATFRLGAPYLTSVTPADSYQSAPILNLRSLVSGGSRSVASNRKYFSSPNGPVDVITTYDYQETTGQVEIAFDNYSDARSFKSTLNFLKGRYKSFWLPSWTCDFILGEDILTSDTNIAVEKDILRQRSFSGDIVLYMRDGSLIPLRVTGTSIYTGSLDKLDLETPMDQDISMSDVVGISVLNKTTLNNDKITVNYTGTSILFNMSVVTVLE